MPAISNPKSKIQNPKSPAIEPNAIHEGDSGEALDHIEAESIALSVWSPPYFVGKSYERNLSYDDWVDLLQTVIRKHPRVLRPGGFMAINIADILCFPDDSMPRIQAENVGGHRLPVAREEIERVQRQHPAWNRYQIAAALGVSEQTIDRRLKNNNIRGGKQAPQTRVKLTGSIIADAAHDAGLYLYDRRVWVKDPCWENSRWHTNSYRAVDEFEYVYIFWKPGITKIDRNRLQPEEWSAWGSRGVWSIPSVKANDDHEAKYPLELPRRLIRLFTDPGEVVLDPFVGSGTTAVAAIEQRRRYIGIEREESHVRMARDACDRAQRQLDQRHATVGSGGGCTSRASPVA